jgi:tripartite-type tricarboxylate transporter receptor subunit TctC
MKPFCGIAVLIAAVGALATPAAAQDAKNFPTRPIRYVLNASPGGGTDIMARKLQQALEKDLGQPIVIDNKPGGRSAAQMAEVTRATPDGYTIGSVTNSHIGAFHQTLKQYSIDSVDWVADLLSEPYILVVPASSNLNRLEDIVALSKTSSKPLVMGGFTRGSGGHVTWEMFSEAAKLKPEFSRWVPFDGVGDAVTALLGGHLDGAVAYTDLVKKHVEAGTLRVIAVLAADRLEALPQAATFAEQGYNLDTGWQQFRGVIAPKNVPLPIKQRIAEAFKNALNSPEMIQYMKEAALVNSYLGPEEFTAYVHQQDRVTTEWLNRLGIDR